jgi:hypothetical protein
MDWARLAAISGGPGNSPMKEELCAVTIWQQYNIPYIGWFAEML